MGASAKHCSLGVGEGRLVEHLAFVLECGMNEEITFAQRYDQLRWYVITDSALWKMCQLFLFWSLGLKVLIERPWKCLTLYTKFKD